MAEQLKEKKVKLALEIRLPFDAHPIMIIGRVVESCEIMKDMIYDTRIEFLTVDERHRKVVGETVSYYIKKEKEEKPKAKSSGEAEPMI